MDNTSSIFLYVKFNNIASFIFLFFTRFWRNSVSNEYKNKSARRRAQLVPIECQIVKYNLSFVSFESLRLNHIWMKNKESTYLGRYKMKIK